jgi:hypothetical protein
MNKLKIITIAIILMIIFTTFYFLKSPLSNQIFKNNEIKIVFLGAKNGIIKYLPLSKNISIKFAKKINKKNETNSIYQQAYQIYQENDKEIIDTRDIYYVYLKDINFISKIFSWKTDIKSIYEIIKAIYQIQTNISIADRITLLPLILNIKASQVVFIDSDENEVLTNIETPKNITLELISSIDKKRLKKIKSILKENNIDILEEKTQKNITETKIIINTINNYSYAKKVADILGIQKEIIIEKKPSICDVILIISNDYKEE